MSFLRTNLLSHFCFSALKLAYYSICKCFLCSGFCCLRVSNKVKLRISVRIRLLSAIFTICYLWVQTNHILFFFSCNVLRYWQEHILRIWINFIWFRGYQINYDMHHKHDYFKFLAWIGCTFPIHFFFFQILQNRGKKSLDKYLRSVPSCRILLFIVALDY